MTGPVPALVTLHLWRVPVRAVPSALRRMATDRGRVRRLPGVRFAKLLGTGSGRTFTPRDADPHHWALLTVWSDTGLADAFAAHPVVRAWDDAADERLRVRMTPLVARGRWSGAEPFRAVSRPSYDGPVAAITRARLRPTRTLSFWGAVPPVVDDLAGAAGLRLAMGIGEAPVGLQGTFSLWDSNRALVDFAYGSDAHRVAVERTGPERWYAEELFARFAVLSQDGTYGGRAP